MRRRHIHALCSADLTTKYSERFVCLSFFLLVNVIVEVELSKQRNRFETHFRRLFDELYQRAFRI